MPRAAGGSATTATYSVILNGNRREQTDRSAVRRGQRGPQVQKEQWLRVTAVLDLLAAIGGSGAATREPSREVCSLQGVLLFASPAGAWGRQLLEMTETRRGGGGVVFFSKYVHLFAHRTTYSSVSSRTAVQQYCLCCLVRISYWCNYRYKCSSFIMV